MKKPNYIAEMSKQRVIISPNSCKTILFYALTLQKFAHAGHTKRVSDMLY